MTGGGIARTTDGGPPGPASRAAQHQLLPGTVASFPSADVAWVCEQGRVARIAAGDAVGDTRTFTTPPALCVATADGGKTWDAHDVPGSGTRAWDGPATTRPSTTSSPSVAGEAWLMVGTVDTFAGGGQESVGLIELALLHTVDVGAHWSVVRDQKVEVGTTWPGAAARWIDVGAGRAPSTPVVSARASIAAPTAVPPGRPMKCAASDRRGEPRHPGVLRADRGRWAS